jgi:hypothetical protein
MPYVFNPFTGTLDDTIPLEGGKIPADYLPSYVDDVLEFANLAGFPATGETGKIYVALDTGFIYRWSGSEYIQIGVTFAAGADTQIQFNDDGSFGGSADLTWDDTGKVLDVGGDINLDDGGSFQTTLQLVTPTAARTITFPDATGTVGLVAGSTGQLVFNLDGAYSGGPLYDNTKGTLGYNIGGAVTQETSKSTGVTLNGASGRITLNAAALDTATTVSFTLTNTSITANDLLLLNHVSGGTAGAYTVNGQAGAGTASINVRNVTAGSLSEAIVIGFAVLKA